MRKIVVFVFLLLMVLLAGPVSAYTYLNIYVDGSGNAEFFGETNETILSVPAGISVQDGEIRGTTSELTQKTGEIWNFSFTLKNAEIKTILPEGSVVKSISNGEIFLERERISIYYQDSLKVSYTISNVSESNSFLIWAILILFVFGATGYFYRQKIMKLFKPKVIYKKPKKKKDHIDMIKHILNEREKLILEKLKQVGKVKMSHLRKLTEIPKASFSRHVQELEKKGLVKRIGEGKNKFVEISRKKF